MLINQPFMEMLELRYIGVVLVFYQFLKEFVGILPANNRCINNLSNFRAESFHTPMRHYHNR